MNKKLLFATAVLVLVAMTSSFTTVNTPTTQPPAGSGGTSQQILFQDDFSNTASGWDRTHNESYLTDYENSGYQINVLQASYPAFANPSYTSRKAFHHPRPPQFKPAGVFYCILHECLI